MQTRREVRGWLGGWVGGWVFFPRVCSFGPFLFFNSTTLLIIFTECASYVVSVVLGSDLVARLNLQAMIRVREQVVGLYIYSVDRPLFVA